MGTVRAQVVIERPVDEVFGWVTDLRHDPQWFTGVKQVRKLSETDYEQVTRLFGWPFVAVVGVVEYEPPHRMLLVSKRSATPFRATYLFEELGPGRTRFTLDAEVYGASAYRILGPLFLPMLKRAVAKRLGNLKRVLELRAGGDPRTPGRA